MQSETADFVPVPPPGELDKTYALSDTVLFGPLYENTTSSTKPEVHNVSYSRQRRSELRSRPNRKFGKFGRVVYEI